MGFFPRESGDAPALEQCATGACAKIAGGPSHVDDARSYQGGCADCKSAAQGTEGDHMYTCLSTKISRANRWKQIRAGLGFQVAEAARLDAAKKKTEASGSLGVRKTGKQPPKAKAKAKGKAAASPPENQANPAENQAAIPADPAENQAANAAENQAANAAENQAANAAENQAANAAQNQAVNVANPAQNQPGPIWAEMVSRRKLFFFAVLGSGVRAPSPQH